MSIIVRNMEMPKRCFDCPCCCAVGNFECLLAKKDLRKEHGINISRPNWCPLIEIPTPHGRLIDIKSVEEGKFVNVSNGFQRWWNGALESVIDNAPTVIEAEE